MIVLRETLELSGTYSCRKVTSSTLTGLLLFASFTNIYDSSNHILIYVSPFDHEFLISGNRALFYTPVCTLAPSRVPDT